jgi:hypothetical protein
MKLPIVFLLASALALTSLYAGPVPITQGQLGYQSSVTFGPSGQPEYTICPTDVSGCGGAFIENIGGINANIWCVDSQESINWGTSYSAYIEGLNGANGLFDANHVHYDGITSVGASGWVYDLSGYGVSNPNSAQTRFKLAAILISQYVLSDTTPTDNTENRSIQDAIWHLTENNPAGDVFNLNQPINVGVPAGYADWIAYAASVLNTTPTSFFDQWAVISGGWEPSPNYFTGTQYQTFLVQVTPEPRFYGLLLVGLLSVCGIVYRRRIAS